MRQKPRIAYVDSYLSAEGPVPFGYERVEDKPEYKKAMRTLFRLEKRHIVDPWVHFNEATLAEIIARHHENPYSFLITDLPRDDSKWRSDMLRHMRYYWCYDDSVALLRNIAGEMQGARLIVYIAEGMDVITEVLQKSKGIKHAVQKMIDPVTHRDFWESEMRKLEELMRNLNPVT